MVADETALAARVARHMLDVGLHAIERHGRFDVALAGGSTPKAAYRLLATAPLRDELDWRRVRFFFGDERCVPPDDAQSNYRMAREELLEPLGIGADAVFRMHGEHEPVVAASAYADVLETVLEKNVAAIPTFDLVMLGMGPDGHTASLFPGADPTEDDARLVRAPYVAKFSTHRITLTPRAINAARDVAVVAAGPAKTDALAAVLGGPYEPRTFPAQILAPTNGVLTWLVDEAAAAKLH